MQLFFCLQLQKHKFIFVEGPQKQLKNLTSILLSIYTIFYFLGFWCLIFFFTSRNIFSKCSLSSATWVSLVNFAQALVILFITSDGHFGEKSIIVSLHAAPLAILRYLCLLTHRWSQEQTEKGISKIHEVKVGENKQKILVKQKRRKLIFTYSNIIYICSEKKLILEIKLFNDYYSITTIIWLKVKIFQLHKS